MKKHSRRALVRRCEIALGELRLSSMTTADRKRLDRVEVGLKSLDDEQAEAKEVIEELLHFPLRSACVPDELLERAMKLLKVEP